MLKKILSKYRIFRELNKIKKYLQKFGLFNGLIIYKKFKNKSGDIKIKINECEHPIVLRANTSDILTFEQIFFYREYDINININPKFIIDGGANIGLASIYFANKYPGAIIYSIEPEKSNIEYLYTNVSYYNTIKIIPSALWFCNTSLKVIDINKGNWGFIVEKSNKNENDSFDSVTIDQLLVNSGKNEIDILKLDIEGAEKELFSFNYSNWLNKVKVLIIELHDQIKPGCKKSFYNAISDIKFSKSHVGENIVLEKLSK